jgi:beta-N-acetylhexosaminidase
VPDLSKLEAELQNPEGTAFFLDLAARSVTVLKAGEFPLDPETAGRVLLAGQYEEFFRAGKAAFPQAVSYRYSPARGIRELAAYGNNADTIIFCLSDEEGLGMLGSLQGLKKKVIVLSVLSPVYLEKALWVDGALAVYSYARESFTAAFSAMLGRIPPGGTLPYE